MQTQQYDVVVVGMGPAGAVLSSYLADAGLHVLALERLKFPRYRIGESLTGIAADVLADLGLSDRMDAIGAVPKPGVKVVGKDARSEFFVPVARRTWQAPRTVMDQMLLDAAIERGVDFRPGSARAPIVEGERVVGVVYETPEGERVEARARFVADCSGHSGFLSRAQVAGPREVNQFHRQIATFSQFEHAERDPGVQRDQTIIFYSKQYHWAWFIPLSPTVTSVGVVVPTEVYKSVRGTPAQVLDWGIDHVNADLKRRISDRTPTEKVRVIRNYSYAIDPFVGPGWLCVGDAHRFADPIFSFGVSIAMTEAKAASQMILGVVGGGDERAGCQAYAHYCNLGQEAAFDLIRYFWAYPSFFAYQTRGSLQGEYIKMLAGDLYDEEPLEALSQMRRSLDEVPVAPPKLDPAILAAANFPTSDLPGLARRA